MANLPEPHPTQDLWGEELNEWLQVGHNPDGTNKGVATIGDLAGHTTDTTNPHDVTAAQTGAYTTGQTDAAIAAAAGAVASDLAAHEADTANPHNVTKPQVGLGNVPNVDATQRSNHTGTQAISTVDGLQAALDNKLGKPAADGVYGQVLTITHEGQKWVDPPGIVYPSLLLSPEGSVDRAGSVSPTITGTVPLVPGQYGQAWDLTGSGNEVQIPNPLPAGDWAVLVRAKVPAGATSHVYLFDVNANPGVILAQLFFSGAAAALRLESGDTSSRSDLPTMPLDQWTVVGGRRRGASVIALSATQFGPWSPSPSPVYGAAPMRLGRGVHPLFVEAVLMYPVAVPEAEIARLMALPTRWSMQNTAVNMALASQPPATPSGASLLSYFPPNRKVAAGGTTLRTAPGASTTAITTLAAGTDVHSTGQALTASSVSYTLVLTSLGQGWVPTTSLI